MKTRLCIVLAALAGAFACDDPSGFSPGKYQDAGPDTLPPGADLGGATADAFDPAPDTGNGPDDDPDAAPEGPEPAFVRLVLDPVQTVYARDEHPVARAEVFDRFGDPIPDAVLAWSVAPAPQGSIEGRGLEVTVNFALEGPGAVRACATPDVCGRATFYVDDGPPVLTLAHPTPGELIEGEPIVVVEGSATGDGVAVFVNDRPVDTDANGAFRVELPATFGLNRVEVLADDGVQRPAVREVREALYAPRFIAPAADGVEIGEALALRLSQRLLDTSMPVPPADEMGVTHLPDLASLLEAVIARLEPLLLLEDPVLAEGEPLDLTVAGIAPGTPDVALVFTASGLEVFLRLSDFALTTQGRLMLEGVPIDLGGDVLVSAAAYARVELIAGAGGAPVLRLETADVAIERIAGRMQDSTAQAVLDTFGSLLRTVLEDFARQAIRDLVAERVPEFIELGLGDVLGTLADLPLDVEADGVIPALHLRAGFALAAPSVVPRGHLTLSLRGRVSQPGPVEAPHPDPGVPDESTPEDEEAGPPWPAQAGAAVAVRLRTVNALLHELWRQGALRIDATSVIPENLRALLSAVQIDARLPPLVVAARPGAPYLFELQAGEVDLTAQGARNPAPDLYTLSIRVGLVLRATEAGLHFEVAPDPDVRAALRQAGGDRPFLPADALAEVISSLAWAELQESIGNGLDLALPEVHLGPETLGTLAPSITDIQVVPTFPDAPRVRHGWFVLGAGLESRLR